LNNLRQLGVAGQLYAGDNQDHFPYPNVVQDDANKVQGWLYQQPLVYNLFNPLQTYQGGSLWPYLNNMAIYRCPMDNTNSASWLLTPQQV